MLFDLIALEGGGGGGGGKSCLTPSSFVPLNNNSGQSMCIQFVSNKNATF